MLFVALILFCGIYSCGWGGSTPTPWLSLIVCALIGTLWALAIGGVPFARSRDAQRNIAVATGAIVTIVTFALIVAVIR